MAKRAAASALPTVPAKIKHTTWGSGQTMYRVHDAIYTVDQFNASHKGNARFSPILDPSGNVIPTLYAATTPRGALMESVFRDVPYRAGFKHVDAKRLEGKLCSTLLFQADFKLLDLSKVALRGLGIPPRQLSHDLAQFLASRIVGAATLEIIRKDREQASFSFAKHGDFYFKIVELESGVFHLEKGLPVRHTSKPNPMRLHPAKTLGRTLANRRNPASALSQMWDERGTASPGDPRRPKAAHHASAVLRRKHACRFPSGGKANTVRPARHSQKSWT